MVGYSEFLPIAANDTPEHRSQNRRVDIVILASAEGRHKAFIGSAEDLAAQLSREGPR